MGRPIWIAAALMACSSKPEAEPAALHCETDGATADCLSPTMEAEYYVEQAHKYFNTMDTAEDRDDAPEYAEWVVRWEWPPWLLLTAFGADHIESTDLLLRLYPSTIPERDCRFFEEQPFARCRVVFYYDDPSHEGRGCPIYEEFAFNDAGEMTVIEAWSDLEGFRPTTDADEWAERPDADRISTRIPGLGTPEGQLDINSETYSDAAATSAELADLKNRANNWMETWTSEMDAAGDDLWVRGCGW